MDVIDCLKKRLKKRKSWRLVVDIDSEKTDKFVSKGILEKRTFVCLFFHLNYYKVMWKKWIYEI